MERWRSSGRDPANFVQRLDPPRGQPRGRWRCRRFQGRRRRIKPRVRRHDPGAFFPVNVLVGNVGRDLDQSLLGVAGVSSKRVASVSSNRVHGTGVVLIWTQALLDVKYMVPSASDWAKIWCCGGNALIAA